MTDAYGQYLKDEMYTLCTKFYDELADELGEDYERVDGTRCKPQSSCLIRSGDIQKLSYLEKPEWSFRVAPIWNWYANLEKNPNPHYIQCETDDLPWAKARPKDNPEGASKPISAMCVALFYDGKYHIVYGEIFNQKTKTWEWKDNTAESVVNCMWYQQYKRKAV